MSEDFKYIHNAANLAYPVQYPIVLRAEIPENYIYDACRFLKETCIDINEIKQTLMIYHEQFVLKNKQINLYNLSYKELCKLIDNSFIV